MKTTPKPFVLSLCLILILIPQLAFSGQQDSLAGHWEGSIDIPGMKLEILVDLNQESDGSWTGKISIPAQNAKNLPLENIAIDGNDIVFEMTGVPGEPAFKGTLSEDGAQITGGFTQSGQTFPFVLNREVSPVAKVKKALADFDDLVNKGLESLNVPGVAVGIVKDDEVILAKGFGCRDVENKLPMTGDTLLAIGSASKAFTTFAMGTLVDDGKLDLEIPVQNYIPWFELHDLFASQRLTPRDLVTHRSGLPRHDLVWYNDYQATREEFVRSLAHLKPTADLRQKFQYNNLMFLTAGYLVEVLTDKKWENAIRSHVLEPLKMDRTNFSVEDSKKDRDHALPYREKDGEIKKIPFRNITNIGPAGSINSSVNEMSQWLLVHINQGKFGAKQIINPQTLQDMHLAHMPTGGTPAIPEVTPASYGMGWFVDTYRGESRVHHGGNIDGFSAMVSLFPKQGLGFVVLANKNGTGLPELLIRHAADLILEAEPKDWIGLAAERKAKGEEAGEKAEEKKQSRRIEGTQLAHSIEDYSGDYHHPGYGDIHVICENRALLFTYNDITTPLEHWHYETFNAREAEDPTFKDMKFTFRTNVNGFVAFLEVPFEPTLDPIVFEKKPSAQLFDPDHLKQFVGKYKLIEQILTISLKGDHLTLYIPGQMEYDLEPALGDEFVLKQVKVISLKFKMDENGKVTAVEFIQPDGIYEAERIKEQD
ncbi:MAG: serine hydrolase [Candidatus Aminicenantes bacterium]|nr:serine hydrolase [Candidatus Aminicenantes bacterium]